MSEIKQKEVTSEYPCDFCSIRGVSYELCQFNSRRSLRGQNARKALACSSCGDSLETVEEVQLLDKVDPNHLIECFYKKETGQITLLKRHLGHLVDRQRAKIDQLATANAGKNAF